MAETDTDPQDDGPKPKSKLPLILGAVLALVGGVGGYLAVALHLLPFGTASETKEPDHTEEAAHEPQGPTTAFVPVDPILVLLKTPDHPRHLRFRATLEVPSQHESEVAHLLPRVSDALNSFLQALDMTDFENRDSLLRLRGQMLHRVKLVVGLDHVTDLLVTEFVIN